MLLSVSNITRILKNYPDLKSEFDNETIKTNEEVMLKYLIKINELEK